MSWGQLWKRRKNQSGGVFEANCSKQMGQNQKTIFHQMFLCLHEGWESLVCRMQIVIVLLEYKIEGDPGDNEGLFERWNWNNLYLMHCVTSSRCRVSRLQNQQTRELLSGRTSVRYCFGSPFSSKVVICGHSPVLWFSEKPQRSTRQNIVHR